MTFVYTNTIFTSTDQIKERYICRNIEYPNLTRFFNFNFRIQRNLSKPVVVLLTHRTFQISKVTYIISKLCSCLQPVPLISFHFLSRFANHQNLLLETTVKIIGTKKVKKAEILHYTSLR